MVTAVTSLLVLLLCYGIQRYSTSIYYTIYHFIFPLRRAVNDVASAARAYENFSRLAHCELNRMHRSYATISSRHKWIGFDLGYTHKLSALEDTIKVNAAVTEGIAGLTRGDFSTSSWSCVPLAPDEARELGQVREVLKHFVRDWSQEGAEERSKTYPIILDELSRVPHNERRDKTVLVPGAGLARLPWEIAMLGFNTTSNEMSPYMNLAFRFLVSRSTTSRLGQHTIHPFAHWFSHQRSNAKQFRTVIFPDVLPSLAPMSRLSHEESDFLKLPPIDGGYHYIVTHYFIDTSHNVISTLQKIHNLLRPGGVWINLGPLLWMNGSQATLELSLEEVLKLSEIIGLNVRKETMRTIPSEYTRDNEAMMRWIYEAEFWIACKKSVVDLTPRNLRVAERLQQALHGNDADSTINEDVLRMTLDEERKLLRLIDL